MAFSADLHTASFTFMRVGMTVMAQSIRPVCPWDIPGCLMHGWPNFLTQNPRSHVPMAAVLLGSFNTSAVLYSPCRMNLSPTAYAKSHMEKWAVSQPVSMSFKNKIPSLVFSKRLQAVCGSCEHLTVSKSTVYPRLFSLWLFLFFSSMHACLWCLLSAIFNVLTWLKVTTKPMQAGREEKQK